MKGIKVCAVGRTSVVAVLIFCVSVCFSQMEAHGGQLQCTIQPEGCDEILSPLGGDYFQLKDRTDLAGKTVCLPAGNYKGLSIEDVVAAEDNYVTIINCGGQVVFDSSGWSNGIGITRSQYIHLTGSGDDSLDYGIVQKNAVSMGLNADLGTSDVEIDRLELSENGYAGIVVRTYPRCENKYNRNSWALENVNLHHNYVHDVQGEAFYVGTSHFDQGEMEVDPFDSEKSCPGEVAAQAELRHIRIHHNLVEDIGLDGIQLGGGVEDVEVYNNIIRHYAKSQSYGHVGGLQINPGTTGKFYNNWIESGPYDVSGTAIQQVGGIGGPTDIYNNVIIGSPTAILTLGRMGGADTPLNIINNTIVNSGSPYFFFCHTDSYVLNYTIKNNVVAGFVNIGDNYWADWSKIFSGGSDNCPINGKIYSASNDPDAFKFTGNTYEKNGEDLGFVNLGNNDLHLEATSSAVAAGEDFLMLVPRDIEGRKRTLPMDNGAYAYLTVADGDKAALFMLIKSILQKNSGL